MHDEFELFASIGLCHTAVNPTTRAKETAMLAMHYRFDLPDRAAIDGVDARVRERGPMFDGFPDMGHKWFLIDRARPCYAVFYLWHGAPGAIAFLDGPLFANLARSFGRPTVRLLLARSVLLPATEAKEAYIVEDDAGLAAVRAFDPRDGKMLSFGFGEGPGRRFEIAYHAVGHRRDAPEDARAA